MRRRNGGEAHYLLDARIDGIPFFRRTGVDTRFKKPKVGSDSCGSFPAFYNSASMDRLLRANNGSLKGSRGYCQTQRIFRWVCLPTGKNEQKNRHRAWQRAAFGPFAPPEEEQGHILDVLAHESREVLLRYSGRPLHSCIAKPMQLLRIRKTSLNRRFPPFVNRFSPLT